MKKAARDYFLPVSDPLEETPENSEFIADWIREHPGVRVHFRYEEVRTGQGGRGILRGLALYRGLVAGERLVECAKCGTRFHWPVNRRTECPRCRDGGSVAVLETV